MNSSQQPIVKVLLNISPDETDALERDEQTRSLLPLIEEQIPDAEAELSGHGETPDGLRGTGNGVGQLIVKLLPESIKGLLGVVSAWVGRDSGRNAKIKVNGIELSIPEKMTPEEMEAMAVRLYKLQSNQDQSQT